MMIGLINLTNVLPPHSLSSGSERKQTKKQKFMFQSFLRRSIDI